jgi:1,2-diacylglycerol 3-alpha-glucosyltransferase
LPTKGDGVVAIYSDSYHPAQDGVVTYIDALRKSLDLVGATAYVVTTSRKQGIDPAENVFYAKGIALMSYPQYSICVRPFSMNRRIAVLEPAVIHSQTPFSMGLASLRAAKLSGSKKIATFHSLVFSERAISAYLHPNQIVVRSARTGLIRYLRWFYSRFDVLISPSNFIREKLEEIGIYGSVVVNNGVDIEKFLSSPDREEARRLLGIPDEERIILYLGRIGYEKNLEILIRAAPSLARKGFRVYIVGSGPSLDYYQKLAEMIAPHSILFKGRVTEYEKILYFSAANVFCNPSQFEVLSTVDIEAMACNTPLLVPSDSSQEEIIEGGKGGMAFVSDDPESLSDRAEDIASGVYSPRKLTGRYSLENHGKRISSIYFD